MSGTVRSILALGSNLGESRDTLSLAVADLVDSTNVRLREVSPIVQTKMRALVPISLRYCSRQPFLRTLARYSGRKLVSGLLASGWILARRKALITACAMSVGV